MALHCFRNRRKETTKYRYKVWRELYHVLVAFMLVMMLLSATQITVLSVLLVEQHLAQVIELSFIKSEQIFANMLAEMKQNELRLISQGLWGSSKAISDSITRPEILVEDYMDTNAAESVLSSFEYVESLGPGVEFFP